MELPGNAKGDNGPGLDEGAVAGLLKEVGRIPNGDVTRLGKAADAWKTFAEHTTITGAADRIKGVNATFTGNTDPNIAAIEAKLITLTQAAEQLAQASKALVTPSAIIVTPSGRCATTSRPRSPRPPRSSPSRSSSPSASSR
ncbi:hypothetical protein [Nocardia fusca]|uniref:hypothetical protein n=1 Tax=Nocardia fusca TaxID=941183 RepID=UPI0007A75CC7|nr:hypothetical protein [Nocardia fusca]